MSTYIKGKDRIVTIEETAELCKGVYKNYVLNVFVLKAILESNKHADKIEELCDEFIGINDEKYQFLTAIPYKCANYWNGGVYGAIWTSKGLIFVAKLNKDGEFELI